MRKGLETEIKVGLFVTVGALLVMLAVFTLGGADTLLVRKNTYYTRFGSVDGLIQGAKVMLNGIRVGTVDEIEFDEETREIRVDMSVDTAYADWIREDSVAEMATQGVLGDKYVSIRGGTQAKPALAAGSMIARGGAEGIDQLFTSGKTLMTSLNSIASSLERLLKTFENEQRSEIFFDGMAKTAKNMAQATQKLDEALDGGKLKAAIDNLNGILEKVNNGTGSLGALINDPGLYYDAKSLVGGANRNRIMRNLVRKTLEDNEAADAPPPKKKK
ncbi:MAG: MCE family protein [Bdellovibrionales bacterium]|nr:MCE family protein [Bdellovibrionales bacterium]